MISLLGDILIGKKKSTEIINRWEIGTEEKIVHPKEKKQTQNISHL